MFGVEEAEWGRMGRKVVVRRAWRKLGDRQVGLSSSLERASRGCTLPTVAKIVVFICVLIAVEVDVELSEQDTVSAQCNQERC